MSRYASQTTVSSDKSRAEIERTLARYGASAFAYGTDQAKAVVQFQLDRRVIRFVLPLPDPKSSEFTMTPARQRRRDPDAARKAWEQAGRQRWRALLLSIKAKLEAVESGISDVEKEFLPWTVLPGGRTVAEELEPQIAAAIESGRAPQLLIEGPSS